MSNEAISPSKTGSGAFTSPSISEPLAEMLGTGTALFFLRANTGSSIDLHQSVRPTLTTEGSLGFLRPWAFTSLAMRICQELNLETSWHA